MNLHVTVTPEARALLAGLETMPDRAMQGIARALDTENVHTVSHIQSDYLSFSRSGPSNPIGLRTQTGRLRQSLHASKTVVRGSNAVSSIGDNVTNKGVNYAAVHEFGAEIPPHKITAKNGKALAFQIGGRMIFARSVNHPGATLPARGMIQRGIADCLTDYQLAISRAIVEALK